MKIVTYVKRILFIILQCTWGILPTLVGLFFFLKLNNYPHKTYLGCIDTRWDTRSGLSLGLFIFTPNDEIKDADKIRVHEYGHCIQSIVLGPLFVAISLTLSPGSYNIYFVSWSNWFIISQKLTASFLDSSRQIPAFLDTLNPKLLLHQ